MYRIFLAGWCGVLAATQVLAEDYFPLKQIQPGMKGITRTVMQGTTTVDLQTEILGVQEDAFGPGKDLIIGRLIDPKTALTGAVHGMSGSPLYIEGKLAGALSRRLALFEKDAHCGFTPIHDMLEVSTRKPAAVNQTRASVPVWSPSRFMNLASSDRKAIASEWLSVPLALASSNPKVLRIAEKLFSGSQFIPVAGGGGGRMDKPGAELLPGAPVAAAMATGDISMAGTGTLTWRSGDKILAFGHPMMGNGDSEFPMCEAEIITTIPSYMRPYKLSNLRRVVGVVEQDRLSAIAGTVGKIIKLPEYEITVRHEGRAPKILKGEFISMDSLSPMILGMLTLEAALGNEETSEDYRILATGKLEIPGHEALQLRSSTSGDSGAVLEFIFDLISRTERIYNQTFEKTRPSKLIMDVDIQPRREEVVVEKLVIAPQRPRSGEAVVATVVLRPRRGEREQRSFRFYVPEELRSGDKFDLEIADARTFGNRDDNLPENNFLGFFSFFSSAIQTAEPESLGDLIEQMNRQRSPDMLVLRVSRAETGFRTVHSRQEGVPESVKAVLDSSSQVQQLNSQTLLEQTQSLGMPISGNIKISVIVD